MLFKTNRFYDDRKWFSFCSIAADDGKRVYAISLTLDTVISNVGKDMILAGHFRKDSKSPTSVLPVITDYVLSPFKKTILIKKDIENSPQNENVSKLEPKNERRDLPDEPLLKKIKLV